MPPAAPCFRPLRAAGRALGLGVALALAARADPAGLTSIPLAPKAHAPGPTMFARLPAEETGITVTNPYDDPRMWGALYDQFEAGSIGTGVAIGDYDGDGRPDVFVVTKTKGCRLYRNLGNYKFEDVTAKAGVGGEPGVWNVGATFVDLNNSGRLDLYVCRFNAPNLLYVNQGDGTFKEMAHAYGLDVKDASVMAAFCDYDRDGWVDLYLSTNVLDPVAHPSGQRGYLFHNNRNGTFTDVTEAAGIAGEAQSHSATWWDFDNDGWPDLYVANDYGQPDRLWHNNRDGTFTDVIGAVLPHTTYYSMGADLGDVGNTGRIDLLVADMAATTHFNDQHSIAESRERLEDSDTVPPPPKYPRSALFLNTGTAHALEAAYLAGVAATDWTWSVRLEDLDNDGRLDLFVTNGYIRDPNPDVNRRSMDAATPAERIRVLRDSPVLNQTHLAYRNLGGLQFESVGPAWGLDQRGVAFGAAFGDLSGDGNLDLVYTTFEGEVAVFRNDCARGHVVNVDFRGTRSNRLGVGTTVRLESDLGVQVRQLVLARGYVSSSEPMLHFGLGADTVVRRMTVTWPSGVVQEFRDLAVDRRYTVAEPAAGGAPPVVAPPPAQFAEVAPAAGLALASKEEAVDEVYLQRLIPERLNRRGPALAVGNIFGAGRDDVVVGGTTQTPLRLLRAGADGTFAAADLPGLPEHLPADDGPLLLFDAAGKGRADLLVTTGGNILADGAPEYQPRLYLNDGRGGFRAAPEGTLPPLPINAGAVAAADFDRSGRLSLFVGGRVVTGHYPEAPQSALLANRGGRFEDVTDQLAPGLRRVGMVTAALWTDVDGDGWPDLLLALEWGPVKYFHNRQGQGFEDWTERAGFAAAGTGWWTALAAADFNGDGRLDYVVGNTGLNTPYRADPVHPALLFVGDFRGNGSSQLVEGYYEGDKLYPRRSRKGLAAGLPAVLKRFPRNDYYARATLEEVVGADRLAQARRYAATELRSGVLLSQPDGTYRFAPLPRLAQIAPLDGLAAGDFSGRGHADLYALQNSYAPIPAMGRFDGGLSQLLQGDGRGQLVPVEPAASGLVVPGDAKGLAVLDLGQNGWPGFLVSRNNGTTLAFRNGPVAGRRFLRVLLHGPAGNPTAVGAWVTVEFADGSRELAEIRAGSGDYSQSSAAGFFGYPETNPPRRIHVRWPDGRATDQAGGAGAPTVEIAAPGP